MADLISRYPNLSLFVSNIDHCVRDPLDDLNYSRWRAHFKNAFRTYFLEPYVTGEIVSPNEQITDVTGVSSVNPKFLEWQFINGQLLTTITGKLSPAIFSVVKDLTTVPAIWRKLEETFTVSPRSHILSLKRRLHEITKGNKSMKDYIADVKSLKDQLGMASEIISDEDLVMYTVNGLPSEYDLFKTSLRTRPSNSPLSIGELTGMLLSEECHVLGRENTLGLNTTPAFAMACVSSEPPMPQSHMPHTNLSPVLANFAISSNYMNHGQPHNTMYSHPQGYINHVPPQNPWWDPSYIPFPHPYMNFPQQSLDNFGNQPQPGPSFNKGYTNFRGSGNFTSSRSNGNNGDNGNRNNLRCQICNKPHHTAAECWHRNTILVNNVSPSQFVCNPQQRNFFTGFQQEQPVNASQQNSYPASQYYHQMSNPVSQQVQIQHGSVPQQIPLQYSQPPSNFHTCLVSNQASGQTLSSTNPFVQSGSDNQHQGMPSGSQHHFTQERQSRGAQVFAPWLLDSGATNHMTHNASQLHTIAPYNGHDQVMVGKGVTIPIHNSDMKLKGPFMNFEGRIVYSKTVTEVEKSAAELLKFVEKQKLETGQAFLGLDIEWRPSFRKGGLDMQTYSVPVIIRHTDLQCACHKIWWDTDTVTLNQTIKDKSHGSLTEVQLLVWMNIFYEFVGVPPGKAAVMQICGGNNNCYVMHIIHSGIPQNLRCLLEDPTLIKVGIGIGGDCTKIFKDHDVSIPEVLDLSNLAKQKLGEDRQWGLESLTKRVVHKQLHKPKKIILGNWEVDALSKAQLKYAATDAFVSWYLYEVLSTYPDASESKSEEGLSLLTL